MERKGNEYDEVEDDTDGEYSSGEKYDEVKDVPMPLKGKPFDLSKAKYFQAIGDWMSAEPGDLSFKKGEIFKIISTRDDGWWYLENESGSQGVAPITYLKIYEGVPPNSFERKNSQTAASDGDSVKLSKSGKDLWSGVKRDLRQVTLPEVLNAMGAFPPGYKPSLLSKQLLENEHLSLSCALVPKLSETNLNFQDLYWNVESNKLRKRNVKFQKIVNLLKVEQLPAEAAGVEISCAYVRVCLFDGLNILSNIHTIKAQYNPKKQTQWGFAQKIGEKQSSVEHSEFFVRSGLVNDNLMLLFEAGIHYKRPSSGEQGDLTCGWATLPIFIDSGVESVNDKQVQMGHQTLQNKSYTLVLQEDGPLDKHSSKYVIPAISLGGSALRRLISANKRPKLTIQISAPTVLQKERLDCLPDILVWNSSFITVASLYRRLLGETLVRNRRNPQSAEMIFDPVLAVFPKAAEQPDLMDVLMAVWSDREKQLKGAEKKQEDVLSAVFKDVMMQSAVALCDSVILPNYNIADPEVLKARRLVFAKFLASLRRDGTPLSWLTGAIDATINFQPFDPFSHTFNLIGPHCSA